jgi:hypothetical protein
VVAVAMAMDDVEKEMTDFVRLRVALATDTFAEIVEATTEYLEDADDAEAVPAAAHRIASRELTAHLREQATWAPITDSDRVTSAFAALNAAGIVAREQFTCCQTCGNAEIGAEVPPGGDPEGYTYYHEQDAERAAESGSLFLAYGSFQSGQKSEAIGARVAAELRGQGLTVTWDGDPAQRISVPLRWQRRRTGDRAAIPPA